MLQPQVRSVTQHVSLAHPGLASMAAGKSWPVQRVRVRVRVSFES